MRESTLVGGNRMLHVRIYEKMSKDGKRRDFFFQASWNGYFSKLGLRERLTATLKLPIKRPDRHSERVALARGLLKTVKESFRAGRTFEASLKLGG